MFLHHLKLSMQHLLGLEQPVSHLSKDLRHLEEPGMKKKMQQSLLCGPQLTTTPSKFNEAQRCRSVKEVAPKIICEPWLMSIDQLDRT